MFSLPASGQSSGPNSSLIIIISDTGIQIKNRYRYGTGVVKMDKGRTVADVLDSSVEEDEAAIGAPTGGNYNNDSIVMVEDDFDSTADEDDDDGGVEEIQDPGSSEDSEEQFSAADEEGEQSAPGGSSRKAGKEPSEMAIGSRFNSSGMNESKKELDCSVKFVDISSNVDDTHGDGSAGRTSIFSDVQTDAKISGKDDERTKVS